MKNKVIELNVIGPRGVDAENDFVVGSNDAANKVEVKVGNAIVSEDKFKELADGVYSKVVANPTSTAIGPLTKISINDTVYTITGSGGEYIGGNGINIGGNIISVDTDVIATKADLAGIPNIKYQIVTALPTPSAELEFNTSKKVFLKAVSSPSSQNVYEEFICVLQGETYIWENIGSTVVDLTNYYTKTEVDGKLLEKQDTLSSANKLNPNYITTISDYSTADNNAVLKIVTDYAKYECASPVVDSVTKFSEVYINTNCTPDFSVFDFDGPNARACQFEVTGEIISYIPLMLLDAGAPIAEFPFVIAAKCKEYYALMTWGGAVGFIPIYTSKTLSFYDLGRSNGWNWCDDLAAHEQFVTNVGNGIYKFDTTFDAYVLKVLYDQNKWKGLFGASSAFTALSNDVKEITWDKNPNVQPQLNKFLSLTGETNTFEEAYQYETSISSLRFNLSKNPLCTLWKILIGSSIEGLGLADSIINLEDDNGNVKYACIILTDDSSSIEANKNCGLALLEINNDTVTNIIPLCSIKGTTFTQGSYTVPFTTVGWEPTLSDHFDLSQVCYLSIESKMRTSQTITFVNQLIATNKPIFGDTIINPTYTWIDAPPQFTFDNKVHQISTSGSDFVRIPVMYGYNSSIDLEDSYINVTQGLLATSASYGLVAVDGTTITSSNGIISAVSSGSTYYPGVGISIDSGHTIATVTDGVITVNGSNQLCLNTNGASTGNVLTYDYSQGQYKPKWRSLSHNIRKYNGIDIYDDSTTGETFIGLTTTNAQKDYVLTYDSCCGVATPSWKPVSGGTAKAIYGHRGIDVYDTSISTTIGLNLSGASQGYVLTYDYCDGVLKPTWKAASGGSLPTSTDGKILIYNGNGGATPSGAWETQDILSALAHNKMPQQGQVLVYSDTDAAARWSLTPSVQYSATSGTPYTYGLKFVKCTQTEYDALDTKDDNTMYIIIG